MQGDLRLGGVWTAGQRAKNHALWVLSALCLGSARHLPAPLLRRLGRGLGLSAHALLGRARSVALANVTSVMPDLDAAQRRALVRACFATLGAHLGDLVAMLSARGSAPALRPLEFCANARTLMDEARGEGRGVVFASAHLGPWERVAEALVAAGVPLVTVARESYDPRFSRLYDRLRAKTGVRTIWRSGPGAATRIVRTLRTGGVLGVPMDLCSRVASIEVPFLGHPARTAVGPARIALHMGAPVVVGTVATRGSPDPSPSADPAEPPRRPSDAALVVTASRIPTSDLQRGADGERELTARINRELSRRIFAMPHAWVWMHERWRLQTEV